MLFSRYVLWILFAMACCISLPAQSINTQWLLDLTEEITEETDLCERCDRLQPTMSLVDFMGRQTIFLRYGCTPLLRRTFQYSLDGELLGMCEETDEGSTCGLTSIATAFTLANNVVPVWTCQTGFTCEFGDSQNLEKELPINVDNTRCAEGFKRLWVSEDYSSYNWLSDAGEVFSGFEINIANPGDYRVTATDINGCESYGNITIEEIEKVEFKIKGKDVLCAGGTTELFATGFDTYRWSNGDENNSIKASSVGEYRVTVTNRAGCEGVASFDMKANEALGIEIVANPDDIVEGSSTQLSINESVSSSMITLWEWSGEGLFDCTDCPTPEYKPTNSGEIVLMITDRNGCRETARFELLLKELPLDVYTPNVILPSGGLTNAAFTIYGGDNIEIIESLYIYDRWGGEVFSKSNFAANDASLGWVGLVKSNQEPSNQYVFTSRVRFTNGKMKVIKGTFTVLN